MSPQRDHCHGYLLTHQRRNLRSERQSGAKAHARTSEHDCDTHTCRRPRRCGGSVATAGSNQKQPLNRRTSIVDLDSSLENRKELARELGYKGDTGDSAAMNTWLRRQVMSQLAAHGGKAPPELQD